MFIMHFSLSLSLSALTLHVKHVSPGGGKNTIKCQANQLDTSSSNRADRKSLHVGPWHPRQPHPLSRRMVGWRNNLTKHLKSTSQGNILFTLSFLFNFHSTWENWHHCVKNSVLRISTPIHPTYFSIILIKTAIKFCYVQNWRPNISTGFRSNEMRMPMRIVVRKHHCICRSCRHNWAVKFWLNRKTWIQMKASERREGRYR